MRMKPQTHIDPLEFNAPEETWSNIFVSGPSATTNDDDDVEEYPELLADDAEGDDSNDMARLEQIFNPERIASLMRERADALRNEDSAVLNLRRIGRRR